VKCPIDDSPLSVSSREGVEIDFCPQCRGVWLDRGELDKIIDRAATVLGASAAPAPVRSETRSDDRDRDRDRDRGRDRARDDDRGRRPSSSYRDDSPHHGTRRKKRSFLDDLFDFD
jgi:hypothetical protein